MAGPLLQQDYHLFYWVPTGELPDQTTGLSNQPSDNPCLGLSGTARAYFSNLLSDNTRGGITSHVVYNRIGVGSGNEEFHLISIGPRGAIKGGE